MLESEIKFYSKKYEVIVLDIIGHGNSNRIKKFPVDYWLENSKVILAIINENNFERINIIGTSGGAIIALNFGINYPERTGKIIADSFVGLNLSEKELNDIIRNRVLGKENNAKLFWEYMHGKGWEEVVDSDSIMLERYFHKFEDFYKGNLSKIECDVLITGSLEDELIENIEDKLKSVSNEIEKSTIYLNKDGNHPFMLSKSKEFRELVLDFLEKK